MSPARPLLLAGLLVALGAIATTALWWITSRLEEEEQSVRSEWAARYAQAEIDRRHAERKRLGIEASVAVDRAFSAATRALESMADDVALAYVDETSAPGKGNAPKEHAAAWTRIQGLLASAAIPPGARVAIYEEPAKAIGWATAHESAHGGLDAWPDRAPDGVLRSEFARLKADASTDSLLWFTAEPGGGVRLHLLSWDVHSYEVEGSSESVDVDRLVEASAPFRAPKGIALRVRCDVAAGKVASEPALEAAKGDPVGDLGGARAESEAIRPADHAYRWTDATGAPRARAVVAGPSRDPLVLDSGSGQARPWWRALRIATTMLFLAWLGVLWRLSTLARQRPPAPSDVTAETAHELKTPLTAMRGELEVALRRERAPEEYRAVIASCLEEVKGLQNLVSQVLLLTRGANAPRADEPVDLASVVRAEVERVRATAKDRAVTLDAPATAVTVRGDPSLLARAVGNLLDNAVLHSVAGGAVRATISVSSGSAVVAVEDDGPGIPDVRREKVFERFWRGPEVGQRGIPGAGLGLPIARWIAESHGGTLVLDPAVTGRARFVLRVPLASA